MGRIHLLKDRILTLTIVTMTQIAEYFMTVLKLLVVCLTSGTTHMMIRDFVVSQKINTLFLLCFSFQWKAKKGFLLNFCGEFLTRGLLYLNCLNGEWECRIEEFPLITHPRRLYQLAVAYHSCYCRRYTSQAVIQKMRNPGVVAHHHVNFSFIATGGSLGNPYLCGGRRMAGKPCAVDMPR